jgi:hypothetical protein
MSELAKTRARVRRQAQRMRIAALVLCFLLGLTGASAAFRVVARGNPSPSGGLLEHLAAHRNDYDVIVIGPSFTRLHVIPPVFDARMNELGHHIHSINVGLSGLRGGELDYYLDRILALRMPKLKWTLCDVTLDQLRPIEAGNSFKRRVIYWHDPAQLSFMRRVIFALTDDPIERAGYLWRHARHAMLKATNVGEGVEALSEGVLSGRPPRIKERSGFYVKRTNDKDPGRRFRKSNGRAFVKASAALARKRQDKQRKVRSNGTVREWRDRIRAQHITPTFIISPILGFSKIQRRVRGDEPLRVFDFNDPERYPELYDPGLHHDRSHFHYGGAVIFTQDLADAFAAQLAGHVEPLSEAEDQADEHGDRQDHDKKKKKKHKSKRRH